MSESDCQPMWHLVMMLVPVDDGSSWCQLAGITLVHPQTSGQNFLVWIFTHKLHLPKEVANMTLHSTWHNCLMQQSRITRDGLLLLIWAFNKNLRWVRSIETAFFNRCVVICPGANPVSRWGSVDQSRACVEITCSPSLSLAGLQSYNNCISKCNDGVAPHQASQPISPLLHFTPFLQFSDKSPPGKMNYSMGNWPTFHQIVEA